MAFEIIYSVFVSSTFDDLREERGEIQKALLKSKCFPIGMELFPSSDDETWDFIKRQIDQADYYIVVIAGRYGSISRDGMSFTEMEYYYARSVGKPILAFIHAAPGTIPAERTEMDPQARERLGAFKKKVQQSVVNFYKTPHELALHVMASLVDLKDRKPGIGFIRADQAIEAKRYADLLEENQRLKESLIKLEAADIPFPGADEAFTFIFTLDDEESTTTLTLGVIFLFVAESILDAQCSDADIEPAIAMRITSGKSSLMGNSTLFASIRRNLFRAGVIDLRPMSENREVFNRNFGRVTYNIWALTDFGRIQYTLLSRKSGEG